MLDHDAQREHYLGRIQSLARTLPPLTAISHEASAVVHGTALYRTPAPVKVTRTRGRGFRTSDVHVHVAGLRDSDVAVVDGVPVTSLARTTVDLARRLPFRDGLVVADSALRLGATKQELEDVLRHQYNWPGIRKAMHVVRHADPRSESALESVVRSRCIELRLPMPDLQQRVYGELGLIGVVDFEWRHYGVVGEADGRVKYLEDALWREKVRQEALEDAGRVVIRWTWQQAHAPDAEFAERLWRRLNLGIRLQAAAG